MSFPRERAAIIDLRLAKMYPETPVPLDHIFHNSALRCVRHEVTPTPASDHHALTADFVWAD